MIKTIFFGILFLLFLNACDHQHCSTQQMNGGAIIRCDDGTTSTIYDGTTGTAYDIVGTIDPCGHQTTYDEVLLRIANGTILASFSDSSSGQNTRFVLIPPGSYQTTDNTGCNFTVDSNYKVTDSLGNVWVK